MDNAPALRLAALFEAGRGQLIERYGGRLQAHQVRAMNAIVACRTGALGHIGWRCSECAEARLTPRSCGHRSCPLCQNHTTTEWLTRQRDKLLPVEYFMVTFTLPAERSRATRCLFGLIQRCIGHDQRLWRTQAQSRTRPMRGTAHA